MKAALILLCLVAVTVAQLGHISPEEREKIRHCEEMDSASECHQCCRDTDWAHRFEEGVCERICHEAN